MQQNVETLSAPDLAETCGAAMRPCHFLWMMPFLLPPSLVSQEASRVLGTPMAWQVVFLNDSSPTVSGSVVDSNGSPLEGVQVWIQARGTGGMTDEAGYFEFDAPPAGEWVLELQGIGFEALDEPITVPEGAGVRVAAILTRRSGICTNACVGTSCLDLGIKVVDASTGRPPEVTIRLRVEFEGTVQESTTEYERDPRRTTLWVGLKEPVETVGWHSLEITAQGYEQWRKERVWLERVPYCHGALMGREHHVELIPEHIDEGGAL